MKIISYCLSIIGFALIDISLFSSNGGNMMDVYFVLATLGGFACFFAGAYSRQVK